MGLAHTDFNYEAFVCSIPDGDGEDALPLAIEVPGEDEPVKAASNVVDPVVEEDIAPLSSV